MIVGTARSILRARGMPGHFWGEAVHTAVFLLNRSPTNALNGKTPYQAWYGKKPPVHFLRVFGCVAYIKHLRPHLSKLDDRGQKVVFIGYQDGSKAYRFNDPSSERVHVARDAVFDEDARWDWGDSATRSGLEPFTVEWEYQLRRERSETQPTISSSPAAASPRTPEVQPATPPPVTPSAPTGAQVEFVTPLTTDHNLDADDDEDVEHRYRTLDNVLGTDTVPGLAHCDTVEAELHAVSVEEPRSLKEADGDPN